MGEHITTEQHAQLAGRARRARGAAPQGDRRGDRGRARARRPLRELRVPRSQERAGAARAQDHHPPRTARGRGDRRGRRPRRGRGRLAGGRRGRDGQPDRGRDLRPRRQRDDFPLLPARRRAAREARRRDRRRPGAQEHLAGDASRSPRPASGRRSGRCSPGRRGCSRPGRSRSPIGRRRSRSCTGTPCAGGNRRIVFAVPLRQRTRRTSAQPAHVPVVDGPVPCHRRPELRVRVAAEQRHRKTSSRADVVAIGATVVVAGSRSRRRSAR